MMSNKISLSENSLELSKMFHEIKNPLALINSSLQLIESDHPEVHTFRYWDQTMEDFARLRDLINELSAFQKGSYLSTKLINLFDFTEDLLEATEAFLLETGTPLILESSILDLNFYGDEEKLRQAIVNLLKNAAESSDPGKNIMLSLSADEEFLTIAVADQGCGMSKDQVAKIFEPFHTTKSYGTGLGLPIVKKIVEAHQGSLSVNSQPGIGTKVKILLPIMKHIVS